MGHQNISRINRAAKRNSPPPLSPETVLLDELGHERDGAQRRLEVVQRVVEQRDQLVDQVDAIRELSERLMEEDERKERHLAQLEITLNARGRRIAELESKLLAHAARVQELERTLKMLADAEDRIAGSSS